MNKTNHFDLAEKIDSFPSFSEILTFRSKTSSQEIFLVDRYNEYTYEKFNHLVNSCCKYFQSIGLKEKDVISFILPNSIEYLIIYFSAIRYRAILNPFPFHMASEEVLEKINDVYPTIIFCSEKHYNSLKKSDLKAIDLKSVNGMTFLECISKFSPDEFKSSKISDKDVAVYYYSSGTTGESKIIEYSHKSMVLMQASMIRGGFDATGKVHLCILPLGHTASLRYTVKHCICTGSKIILYESFWKIRSKLWDEIEKYEVTFFQTVPSILVAILNAPNKNFSKKELKSIKFIGCGSSVLPISIQKNFEEKFGMKVSNLYGLSETGATHFDNPFNRKRKLGSIGKPFDKVKARIFNEKGDEANHNETGEIGIKGPGILKGYLNNKKLFNKNFHKNFFMSGDLGYKDENGIFYYEDRKKDLIIKGGVNIIPSQIEKVILQYNSIKEVAVLGKTDMLFGETIVSYLVTNDNIKVSLSDLRDFCEKKLGNFKTPSEFIFLKSLPKGPSGKILKKNLRQ